MKKVQIGVMGPAKNEYPENEEKRKKIDSVAERIGELLAEKDAIVFTGGTDGVMKSASKGAKRKGGMTVGAPGRKRGSSNEFVDAEIVTEVEVGSFIFAGLLSCDAIIFIPGGAGTLAELCFAYRNKQPIVILKEFDDFYDKLVDGYLDEGKVVKIYGAENAEEVVELALKLAKGDQNE